MRGIKKNPAIAAGFKYLNMGRDTIFCFRAHQKQ